MAGIEADFGTAMMGIEDKEDDYDGEIAQGSTGLAATTLKRPAASVADRPTQIQRKPAGALTTGAVEHQTKHVEEPSTWISTILKTFEGAQVRACADDVAAIYL